MESGHSMVQVKKHPVHPLPQGKKERIMSSVRGYPPRVSSSIDSGDAAKGSAPCETVEKPLQAFPTNFGSLLRA